MGVMTDHALIEELSTESLTSGGWVTLVWDDPVNLMPYVTYVFRSYFGFSREKAQRLMMQVHTEGKAAVAAGDRETMERHVSAMHGYGLQATVEAL